MKLIQGTICLPLAWPYAAVIMGLWLVLLSEKPSGTSRVVRQQITKTIFKLFNFYSYIIFGPGGYSGFQVTGMIEWSQKSRPKKFPRASSKTQKNPWTKN